MADETKPSSSSGLSRRTFLKHLGAGGAIASLPHLSHVFAADAAAPSMPAASPDTVRVTLTVNGNKHVLDVEPRSVLLDVLRDRLLLPGTKKGCDQGQCGACTVLINGRRVDSCLTLAVMHDGDEITTIEGIANSDGLHPMQTAFMDCDAFQCGGCTSGQIVSAVGLLKEPVGHDDESVREAMSGNICRCGAYKNILAAVKRARGETTA